MRKERYYCYYCYYYCYYLERDIICNNAIVFFCLASIADAGVNNTEEEARDRENTNFLFRLCFGEGCLVDDFGGRDFS